MNYFLENSITFIFSGLIALSPYLIKLIWRKRDFSAKEIIGVAATLGILGTFVGIYIALQSFDVSNINGSIPGILEGLKTAFLTSIVGMCVGLIVKFMPFVYGIKTENNDESDDEGKIIIELLRQLNNNSKGSNEDVINQLKNIERALSGDGETTLLTQIQKLRTSFNDKQDDLIKEFRVFAKHVAENSSKAIVEALTEVIKDFNNKITEQFGENFKQLNQGVGQMLEWQKNYKDQVNEMTIKLNETYEIMKNTQKIVSKVVDKADEFTVITKILGSTMETINTNNQRLNEGITNFAELGKKASNSLPLIEKNLNAMTKGFSDSINSNIKSISDLLNRQEQSVNEQISNVRRQQEMFNHTLEAQMKETNSTLVRQFSEYDKMLGEQLNKSLQTLGNNLAGLSQRFVQDYTPLTDSLRNVVRLASGVRN